MKRRIVLLLIGVLIMAESLTGCTGNRIEDRKAEAKALLEEKYNETFTVVEYLGQESSNDYYKVTAYADNHPDIIFSAAVETADDKGMSDNYGSKRVSETISDAFSKGIKELDSNYYVYTEFVVDDFPVNNPDMSIEEMQSELYSLKVTINVYFDNDYEYNEIKSVLEKGLSEIPMFDGVLRVFCCDEKTLKELSEYLKENETLFFDMDTKMDDFEIKMCRFANGSITEELR